MQVDPCRALPRVDTELDDTELDGVPRADRHGATVAPGTVSFGPTVSAG